MLHSYIDRELCLKNGITNGMLHISVNIETTTDIEQALRGIGG